MSCKTFSCDYEFPMFPGRHGSQDTALEYEPSLRDLIGSDESFVSMLEAIRYLNFPGF
ncbi:MAG: hypothetical protein V1862_13020 [Methanobacteriota archaeon]